MPSKFEEAVTQSILETKTTLFFTGDPGTRNFPDDPDDFGENFFGFLQQIFIMFRCEYDWSLDEVLDYFESRVLNSPSKEKLEFLLDSYGYDCRSPIWTGLPMPFPKGRGRV